MLTFPTNTLFIEGPDCSGKTSLIREIHGKTSYSWHLMDRSQLSRSLFAEMYSRNLNHINDDLHSEIYNLNNRYVILNFPFEVIEERFKKRGDEIHDHSSLKLVHNSFKCVFEKFKSLPNVINVTNPASINKLSDSIIASLKLKERALLKEVANEVIDSVRLSKTQEVFPLSVTLYDDGDFEEADETVLDHESESDYYKSIYDSLLKKIENEFAGNNEYNRKEDLFSRRFVFTGDSCISFIQVSQRNEVMDFHCVIRSCNVISLFEHDLRFLYYLASMCWNKVGKNCNSARIRLNLNSAHIIE
jgi:hypothetical protein